MPRPIYLDSGVILSYLEERPDRLNVLQGAFSQASRSAPVFAFFTSVMAIAEVAFVIDTQAEQAISESDLAAIDQFWNSRLVHTVEVNVRIARLSRDIMRDQRARVPATQEMRVKARSVDTLHIGTALYIGCEEIWTYDDRMLSLDNWIPGLKITEPHVDQLGLL